MSLTICNCRLMQNGKEVETNIHISNGIIRKIGEFIDADEIIEADGRHVIPGVIDPHVHFRQPDPKNRETWESASKAAVSAGVTTVLDMPNNNPPVIDQRSLDYKRTCITNSFVNYGFHLGAAYETMTERVKDVAATKVYVGASADSLHMDDTASLAFILANSRLTMVHAEDESLAHFYTRWARMMENKGIPPSNNLARPNICAEVAVQKLLTLAKKTKARLYIAHVSTKEEVDLILDAKQRGINVYAEVTPHHLFLTHEDDSTTIGKVNPPLRTDEDRTALWEGLKRGVFDCIGSDHAPHLWAEKNQAYYDAPSGIAGIETMLPLLLNAVNHGLLTLTDVVRLTSVNPALIFGIRNKGRIAEGYDADLVIVDMKKEKEVRAKYFHSKAKFSPFNGWMLQGWPVMTIVNGKVAWHEGNFLAPHGQEVTYE